MKVSFCDLIFHILTYDSWGKYVIIESNYPCVMSSSSSMLREKENKSIKLGICGEHGGDPKSIHFCSRVGLNYISCSPYRVPIAKLAAAQAELKKK